MSLKKLRITFKDPDALYNCIREQVVEALPDEDREEYDRMNAREQNAFIMDRVEEAQDAAREWLRWGEYVELEIDIVERTCRVVKP